MSDNATQTSPEELLARYELKPGKEDVVIEHDRQLWQARYSPCGDYLIGCGYDATIQRWDLRGDEPVLMKPLTGHSGWVQQFDFVANTDRLVSADSWGQIACWNWSAAKPERIWSLPEAHDGWIRAIAVSPDGKTFATGGNDRTVRLWSTADGKLQSELTHPHRVFSLRFHPTGALVSGDLEGTIREWAVADNKEVRQLNASVLYADEAVTKERIQQCGGVRHLQFNTSGTQLVCGGQKEPSGGFAKGTPCVIVFDWETGEPIREMPMGDTQDGFSYDAQFHPDGFVMATSSAFPGKGHVWFRRPEDEKEFFSSRKLANGRSLSLHPDGSRVAHLTADSRNGNGRPLVDGDYVGGKAVIRIMRFPTHSA